MTKSQTIDDLLPNIDEYHHGLSVSGINYLEARGIGKEIVDRCKIGQCQYNGKRWFTIPIFNAEGKAIQVVLRKHADVPDDHNQKRYLLPKGSHAELFGIDLLTKEDPDTIFVCEGLLDACAARTLGLSAISGSAGAGTFKDEWFNHIPKTEKKRKLIVCFDKDPAGVKGASEVLIQAARLRPDLELAIIDLPLVGSGKDLTDFLLQCTSADKKEALLALAKPYTPRSQQEILLDLLSKESSFRIVAPCQGYMNGKGYIMVTLRREGRLVAHTVTSNRECFYWRDPKCWIENGCCIDREPVADATPRWEQKQLLAFVKKEDGETLSLGDAILYVREHLKKYLDFQDPRCFSVVATWIIMTYCYRLFPAIPYLHLTGLKGAGKTKLIQAITLLSFNGQLVTSSSSAASIIRLVHGNGATLGVDEAETFGNSKDENSAVLQDILRSGYKQGIYVTKCEKDEDGNFVVVLFDPFSPKVLSGIKGLEDALSTRCIELMMLRTTNIKVANSEIVPSSSEWSEIRALVYPAVLLSVPEIYRKNELFAVTDFTGRNAELWKPLLLLSDVAGIREIQEEILSYALSQVDQKKDDDSDTDIGNLLRCIHELLGAENKRFIPADEIFRALTQDDDFAWLSEPRGITRRGKWLNNCLKRLDLWRGKARCRSCNGEKEKGYDIERKKLDKAATRLGVDLTQGSVLPVTETPPTSQ